MPIVNITSNLQPRSNPIKINIREPESVSVKVSGKTTRVIEYKLNMRRALNGDIMVFDHKDIDIMILIEKKKVVAFAKDTISDATYGAEKRLFDYLRKRGIVQYDSIEGGNVYGSLQGLILESKEVDSVKMTLYEISKWLKEEQPFLDNNYDDMIEDEVLSPSHEESTELGEVPHAQEKGSIRKGSLFTPYLYGRYTY